MAGGEDFARAFMARLVEQTSASWDQYFGMLEQYVEDNKDALVPQDYVVDLDGKCYYLGVWVNNQRRFYAIGQGISDWISPQTVEACTMRSGHARNA